jgi:hypothetical protein
MPERGEAERQVIETALRVAAAAEAWELAASPDRSPEWAGLLRCPNEQRQFAQAMGALRGAVEVLRLANEDQDEPEQVR